MKPPCALFQGAKVIAAQRAEVRMKSFERFRLDVANQCLWRGETRVSLMPKPFAVLRYLVEHPGRLVTHDQLLSAIWPDTYVQPEVLRRYILEIRRALGDRVESPRFIRTFPKRGYQFVAPVTDDALPNDLESTPAASTPLVGRGATLDELDRYLSRVLSGHREVVFVVGEPGIGKTSLVDAFQRATASRLEVAIARGQSVEGFAGKEPYYPLLEALSLVARGPSGTVVVDTLATHAPTWLIQFPSLIRADQQAALQREIQGATRERMVRELCEALEVITQTVPLVLILEDLHWVDPSTVDVVSAIARRREPARLLLVGTFRPADLILSESPLKTLKHDLQLHHLSREVELERLGAADVADYVAAAFAPGDVPAAFGTVIHRHSDGNPLFMVAMLDHLQQQGVLAQVEGRWVLTVPLEKVNPGVPETLKQMLQLQLEHASAAEQHLLTCASVAGLQFTACSIEMMLEGDVRAWEELCEGLADRQQFIRFAGTRDFAGSTIPIYEFRHALYREVLYRRVKPAQRVMFHHRLAAGLERRFGPASELAAKIALNFEQAGEYDHTIRWLLRAAQNATERYAHAQAIAVLDHARELVPKLEGQRRAELELQILETIGNARYALGDMDQSAATYQSMCTRAAELGQLAAVAEALTRHSHPAESIPFFLRAVEIDPDFASGYVALSRIYSNLGEADRAREYARAAYERRDRVGDRERLSITYQYHYEVTGDQSRANRTLEEWKHSFPLEFQPVNSLALIHNFLGDFDRAIEEGLEAVRRNSHHGYPYSNLAQAYLGKGQFDEARQTAERAVALEIETLPTRRLLYQLDLLDGNVQAAARQLEWAKDRPREFDMIGARAQAAGWAGKVAKARQLFEEAARLAEHRKLPDVGTSHLASVGSMELACGNKEAAAAMARRVLDRNPGYDSRLRAAFILGATGCARGAEAIVTDTTTANPEHTLINSVLAPIARAGIELGRRQPARAIDYLKVVAPYELGFIAALAPIYLRAESYLMLEAPASAAWEFQRILDHRGVDPFSPFHAVALLGLARARAAAGDAMNSLRAYSRFLADWAEADPDIPVLIDARREYDRLSRMALQT
jgi:DNA-binding winged helix-turn-helix (wHTH) protein/tetratricopeptide (TPR) repeat protein